MKGQLTLEVFQRDLTEVEGKRSADEAQMTLQLSVSAFPGLTCEKNGKETNRQMPGEPPKQRENVQQTNFIAQVRLALGWSHNLIILFVRTCCCFVVFGLTVAGRCVCVHVIYSYVTRSFSVVLFIGAESVRMCFRAAVPRTSTDRSVVWLLG